MNAPLTPDFWNQFRATIRPDKFGCIHPAESRMLIQRTLGLHGIADVFIFCREHRTRMIRETNRALKAQGWRLRRKQQPTGYAKAEKIAA